MLLYLRSWRTCESEATAEHPAVRTVAGLAVQEQLLSLVWRTVATDELLL